MPHHVEFIGIHNSLKLTLGIMKDILEYANTELSYEEQDTYEADIEAVSTQIEELQDRITALKDALDLAERTKEYIAIKFSLKPGAEVNHENLADELDEQIEEAEELLEDLEIELADAKQELTNLVEDLDAVEEEKQLELQRQMEEALEATLLAFEDNLDFPEIDGIDLALGMLLSKKESIGKRAEVAKDVADVLYNDLWAARNQYRSSLIFSRDKDGAAITPAEARQIFNATCNSLIMDAMPILEQDDLSWGDLLRNLMKAIANTVIKVATVGTVSNFFKPVQSTKEIITEANDELQSDFQSTATI